MIEKSRLSAYGKTMLNEIKLNSRISDLLVSRAGLVVVLDMIANGPYGVSIDTAENIEMISEFIFRSNTKIN